MSSVRFHVSLFCFRRLLFLALCIGVVSFPPLAQAEVKEVKKVLLVGQGPDGHPPGTHEFMPGLRILKMFLDDVPQLELRILKADEPWTAGPQFITQADGIVLYLSQGARWVAADPQRTQAIKGLLERGGGLVGIHWAIGAKDAEYIDGFLQMLGGIHGGPDRKYQVLETELRVADRSHPITRGIDDLTVRDEFYYRLKWVQPQKAIQPVLQARIDDRQETVAWGWQRPDGGRSFGFSGLHFHDNWRLESYRRLVAQAVLWSLDLPIPDKGLDVRVSGQVLGKN